MIATQHIAGSDWEEIRRLFKQVSQSVHYLHSKGVIHGDLKPTNIVEVNKAIKLIDFDGSVSFAKHQMAIIPKAPHACYFTDPSAFNRLVVDFAAGEKHHGANVGGAAASSRLWPPTLEVHADWTSVKSSSSRHSAGDGEL